MDAFVVTDTAPYRAFSPELPNTAVTGHPYLSHVAPLALFNPTGSGLVVRVRRVDVLPLMEQSTTTPSVAEVYRITAHTGATDTVAATALDSANAALPAQVVCARAPASITTTGDRLDSARSMPLANDTRAVGYAFAQLPLSRRLGRADAATAELQRIVLREGQGIAATMSSSNGLVWRGRVVVVVRNVSGGACYAYGFAFCEGMSPRFSLLNGSGSGVVLEVVSVGYVETGTDVVPQIALEPIDGIGDGEAVPIVPMDSTASAGTLIARRNCAILMRGAKAGALISVPHMQWRVPPLMGIASNVGNLVGRTPFWQRGAGPYMPELDLVLREGEGVAITYKNAGSLGRMLHGFTFTATGPVYPAVGDVRSGIDYGPNGTDYEGTLVVGGGGNTYSRGRVVNA